MSRTPNGFARVAYKKHWPGLALRFGKDPDEVVVRELPARITKLRVFTSLDRFDRETGKDLGRYNVHIKSRRLIAYKINGQEWVDVSTPKEKV